MGSSLERLKDWVAHHLRSRATPDLCHRALLEVVAVGPGTQECSGERVTGMCLQKMFQKNKCFKCHSPWFRFLRECNV